MRYKFRMSGFKGKSIRRRGIGILLLLVLLYLAVTIGYYSLPWSVRKHVCDLAPSVDRELRSRGYSILQGLDELALIGRDVSVPIENSLRADYAYAGFPAQGFKLFGRLEVLENRGYVAGYSESLRNPLWVCYRIFDVPELHSGKRPSRFSVDKRTRAKVAHDDYTRSGFDRGHMAPNYGIATRYGREAQKETFLMSNIIPQTPRVNQHIWKDLEMRVAQTYGRCFREVWVITGPVFDEDPERLDSGVAIPSSYYKIIVDESGGRLRVLAFLVPRNCPPYTRIKSCLVSIDKLEQYTNLDFFPELPDDIEDELEAKPAGRLWPQIVPSLRYSLNGKTD